MPVRIEPNTEPIAGYRLIERLGGGGFGEVWKCEAPGGLFKAIKFVYGDMDAVDESDGSRAEQELKALKRVKSVHHPYILSLERFDIIEGQLMIVMELADRTLWDRFRECRNQGLPGIPREELLGYMRETAEALDLMNDQFQLQHLDIKPQNLFLVFNHIKVADFGLVKDLGNKAAATITGGVTPVYAAPETFDGWLSRFSDQYSLAIVYQELLTGSRPFAGATMRQLVLQHLQGDPDLAPLPALDQPIVARALSKDPDRRFPNCLAFLQQLIDNAAPPRLSVVTEPPSDPGAHAADLEPVTEAARRKCNGELPAEAEERLVSLGRPHVVPPRPDRPPAPAERSEQGQSSGETPSAVQTQSAGRRGPAKSEAPKPKVEQPGLVQPAVVLGLGGIGLHTLLQLRKRLTAELGRPDELPMIRLLGLDTDPDALQAASVGEPGQALQPAELLPTRLHRPSHYFKPRDSKTSPPTWLNTKLLYRIPRHQHSAGLRPLGRLAFVDSYRIIGRRLEAELRACSEAAAAPPARPALKPRGMVPRVYIVTCLAGNTGSGMFLDTAFTVRELLRRLGHPHPEVIGLLYLPTADVHARPVDLAQAYAALTELQYFCRHPFAARYGCAEPNGPELTVFDSDAPFSRCMLIGVARLGTRTENTKILRPGLATAGEILYRDIATPLGPAADRARQQCAEQSTSIPHHGPTFHAVGISRLNWPRVPLLEKSARKLCHRLVQSWMSKDARPLVQTMASWTAEKWDALALRPEALITGLHEMCERIVRQPPDRLVTAITGPLAEAMAPREPNSAPVLGPAVTALAELDRLVGVAEECRPSNQPAPAPGLLETALAEATGKVADAFEQRFAEQIVRLIEDPRYRLAGAEEALRQLTEATERALQSQEALARELNERAVQLYQKAQKALDTSAPGSGGSQSGTWKLSRSRRTPAPGPAAALADLIETIRQYPKARYHALVLHHVNRLYVSLRGQLSDQLREVGFCRQRLGELANLVKPSTASAAEDGPTPTERILLPSYCPTLDDALEQIEKSLTRDDLVAFDQHVQAMLRQQFRALVHVCMGNSGMVRTLAPVMIHAAREFLAPRFDGTSVAELLLGRHEGNETIRTDQALSELHEVHERAKPKHAPGRPNARFTLAFLPDDAKGTELQTLLETEIPDATVQPAERPDEIVFYREHLHFANAGFDQLGKNAQEAYQQRLAVDPIGLHTREDIPEWQPLALAAR